MARAILKSITINWGEMQILKLLVGLGVFTALFVLRSSIVGVPGNFSAKSPKQTSGRIKNSHQVHLPPTMFSSLSYLKPRQLAAQILNFGLILSTAFMLWKGLSIASDSPSPIVVVLSGSMEPAFQRGDLLFLWNRGLKTEVGEIVVYNVRGKDIPIVHRVVRRFSKEGEPLQLLTKGDNNLADDTELYAHGQDYLNREKDIIGSVVGYMPYVGYVTILLSEHPWLKTVMLGLMGLMVIMQRE
ncbi:Signal peptidase complex catalytic subunit [Glutinoglossum americanum]|uniref:Signal peptidase complex catalytic subunit SEC11 n=1 Tax=Glutinoglossum americanum TaxID=1670608 RepID=A0A9P8L5S3_9PEZI|nr:Signal peptidase complex catalytic subunit [Glutinoglossum americanum]